MKIHEMFTGVNVLIATSLIRVAPAGLQAVGMASE